METLEHPARQHLIAQRQYMLLHKRLVGPKTAEKLFLLYRDLSTCADGDFQRTAGWAAAEAALVATDRSIAERLEMLDLADTSWLASQLAFRDHAQNKEPKRAFPNRSSEFRVQTDRVFIPVLKSFITQSFDSSVRQQAFDELLGLAITNAIEAHDALMRGDSGTASNHLGLAHEHTTYLSGNRLLSGKVIMMPSLARSGNGSTYARMTHDVQVAYLRRGRLRFVVPYEVKANEGGASGKYDSPVVSGAKHLGTRGITSLLELLEAFLREREGVTSPSEDMLLQNATNNVIHLTQHYVNPQKFGAQCLEQACKPSYVPHPRHAS